MIFLFITLLFIVVNGTFVRSKFDYHLLVYLSFLAHKSIDKETNLSTDSSKSLISPFQLFIVTNTSSTSYVCSANRSQITFTLLNGSHSAKDSTANCRLSTCLESSNANVDCRTSRTPCFEYQHVNGTSYCAPAVQCSILAPCDEVTNRCTSTKSICVVNSCCTPNHVCLPISLINTCPPTRSKLQRLENSILTMIFSSAISDIETSTTSVLNTVTSNVPIINGSTSIDASILLLIALVMALTSSLRNVNN